MSKTPEQTIEFYEGAFHAFGYFVGAEAIPGSEAVWADTLKTAFEKVETTLAYLRTQYRCRGRSKRVMNLLHSTLPVPTWGVELLDPQN